LAWEGFDSGWEAPDLALLDGFQIGNNCTHINRQPSAYLRGRPQICAGSKSGCATGKRGPDCGNALGFVELGRELFLRAIAFPSAAALKLAHISKPPPSQSMPFLGDPIDSNFVPNSCH
jgi:hypothetical protein